MKIKMRLFYLMLYLSLDPSLSTSSVKTKKGGHFTWSYESISSYVYQNNVRSGQNCWENNRKNHVPKMPKANEVNQLSNLGSRLNTYLIEVQSSVDNTLST